MVLLYMVLYLYHRIWCLINALAIFLLNSLWSKEFAALAQHCRESAERLRDELAALERRRQELAKCAMALVVTAL
jgi:hypothetical protein